MFWQQYSFFDLCADNEPCADAYISRTNRYIWAKDSPFHNLIMSRMICGVAAVIFDGVIDMMKIIFEKKGGCQY